MTMESGGAVSSLRVTTAKRGGYAHGDAELGVVARHHRRTVRGPRGLDAGTRRPAGVAASGARAVGAHRHPRAKRGGVPVLSHLGAGEGDVATDGNGEPANCGSLCLIWGMPQRPRFAVKAHYLQGC